MRNNESTPPSGKLLTSFIQNRTFQAGFLIYSSALIFLGRQLDLGLQNFDLNVEEELYGEVEEEDVIDVIPKEEGIRTTNLQTSIKVQDEYDEENAMQLEEEEALDYEFDLRDAVISSEILNPPYINR